MAQKKYRKLRAVVEVNAPPGITEKQLVLRLKQRLPRALNLGRLPCDGPYLQVEVKQYSRVRQAEIIKEGKITVKRYQIALLILCAIAVGWGLSKAQEALKSQPQPVVVEELK